MIDIRNGPDRVLVYTDGWHAASAAGNEYVFKNVKVRLCESSRGVNVELESAGEIMGICLKYRGKFAENTRVLGDHWERAYADLGFDSLRPEKALPWYFIAYDGKKADCYGVKTGPNAFCAFFAYAEGFDLVCDVRNGGGPVSLGDRALSVCTLIAREGKEGESAFEAGRAFCRMMCEAPRLPAKPVYGSNNWYYAYGNSSHSEIVGDTELLAELTKGLENRPYMVIDDGWQVRHDPAYCGYNGGPWNCGNEKFPDMAGLAAEIASRDIIPGIWMRPLFYRGKEYESLGLSRCKDSLDPTLPAAQEIIRGDVSRIAGWGYRLIKHDFTTVDITGKWGPHMTYGSITDGGWNFADRSRTTAEIVLDLYRLIREAAGDAYIIGCNTFSHLSAGIFEIQRTGDDTSGTDWRRTRRYGVNTAAFRSIQHGAFYAADADCVGITDKIPWEMNRQWLELLANSGTPLFVSADPRAMTPEIKEDIRRAFALASREMPLAEPLDWAYNDCPSRWRTGDTERVFKWQQPDKNELDF